LLGCVGNCWGRGSLAEDVTDLTRAAALDDPRFRPAASVSGPIEIEISVLTPFRRIWNAAQCVVGKHGLFLKLGSHAGLLLPQVAAEHGWTTDEFLQAVSRKATLGPRAWRDPQAKLYVFEAQVFG
jgi:AmmeMemoRadiSam system protein A